MKLPLPVPVPPSVLPAASTIESSSTRFRPSVPSPAIGRDRDGVRRGRRRARDAVGAVRDRAAGDLDEVVSRHAGDVLAERDRPVQRRRVLGFGSSRVIETTVGAVLSITIVWPVKLPLPVPVPPSLLPTASVIESSSTRSSRSVPSPEPVVTVTVSVALGPPGVTEMMPSPAIEFADVDEAEVRRVDAGDRLAERDRPLDRRGVRRARRRRG